MYDLNLNIPNITSKKYSTDSRFLLLKNYLVELNETISFALADKVEKAMETVYEKTRKDTKDCRDEVRKYHAQSVSKYNELKDNVSGIHSYETLDCVCTENGENLIHDIRFFPCLNMVFVRIRLSLTTTLSAGVTYYLAQISQYAPGVFVPLQSIANLTSGGQSTAGVTYKTGEVVFRSDVDVPAGTSVYISGFYLADYQE